MQREDPITGTGFNNMMIPPIVDSFSAFPILSLYEFLSSTAPHSVPRFSSPPPAYEHPPDYQVALQVETQAEKPPSYSYSYSYSPQETLVWSQFYSHIILYSYKYTDSLQSTLSALLLKFNFYFGNCMTKAKPVGDIALRGLFVVENSSFYFTVVEIAWQNTMEFIGHQKQRTSLFSLNHPSGSSFFICRFILCRSFGLLEDREPGYLGNQFA